jgi:hypothetical protein
VTIRYPALLWAFMPLVILINIIYLPELAGADNRVGFVVGIGSYDKLPAYQQLRNPVNDAKGVSEKLAQLGFKVTYAPNVTRGEFNTLWQDTINTLTDQDTLLLFFSGHGVQIEGQNYLLPRDIPYIEYGRSEQLKREAISLNELLSDLTTGQRPHPKNSVLILDACRDNPLVPHGFKGVAPGGLAKVPEPEGVFILYSAASGGTSLDRLSPRDQSKYSLFTRVLLPLMERKDIEIQSLARRLRNEVSQLAQNAGHEQRPAYYDGIDGEFCLPGCATTPASSGLALHPSRAAAQAAVQKFVHYVNAISYHRYEYSGCVLISQSYGDFRKVILLSRVSPYSIGLDLNSRDDGESFLRLTPKSQDQASDDNVELDVADLPREDRYTKNIFFPTIQAQSGISLGEDSTREQRIKAIELLREAVIACQSSHR